MKVKSLRRHDNAHGDTYEKHVGKVYEVADDEARGLIDNGYVEAVNEKADKPKSE